MSDFLDIASDLLRSRAVEEKRAQFERVFAAIGALQAVHSKSQLDLNNIESIFTVLELGRIIQTIPGIKTEEIPETIAALKELIVKTLEVRIKFPLEGSYVTAPKQYEEFAKLIKHLSEEAWPKLTSSVISFNYDIAADVALYRAGLGPDYVIEKPPNVQNPIPLLKLHGSLNWATELSEIKRIRPLHLSSFFQAYNSNMYGASGNACLDIGTKLFDYFKNRVGIEVEREPVIVPPSWNKADYHLALSDVWAAAAKHLSEAEHIFVIGYSLPETDSFFRHLYALGSASNTPLRRFEVFNPDTTGEIDKRFRSLLGPGAAARYAYHEVTFDTAISRIKKLFPKNS